MRKAALLVFIAAFAAFAPLAAAAKGGIKALNSIPKVGTRRLQGRGRGGHHPGGEGIFRSFGCVRHCFGE